jgi:hypothetical protein
VRADAFFVRSNAMTRASSTPPSRTQSHARPNEQSNVQRNDPANTMDEPGGPEAPLAEQEAEEIARAAAKRAREGGSRDRSREPARHDEIDPDFKPPIAPHPSGDDEG